MNSLYYWLIAIGVIFVGVNISINGIELILPTFLGYALIAIASWKLRAEDTLFRYIPLPASILAVLAFPDLFRNAIVVQPGQVNPFYTFDLWTFYPDSILHIAVFAAIAIAIARLAIKWDRRPLIYLATISAALIVVFEIPRFFMPFPSYTYYLVFFAVTTLYHALLTWTAIWAATRLPS